MEAGHRYKIGYCGSKQHTGVGYIGNVFMVLNELMNDNVQTLYVENSNTYYNSDMKSHFFEWFLDQKYQKGNSQPTGNSQHFLSYYDNSYLPNDATSLKAKRKFWHNYSFNDFFKKELNDNLRKLQVGKDTIGVQVRSGDMPDQYKCDLESYYVKVSKSMESTGADKIFLACDSPITLDYFGNKFSNLKYLTDIYRSTSTDPFKRMDNLAKEAMLDTFILSNCDYIIKAKTSALSLVATLLAEPDKKIL